ncbi:MAG: T9SS type A sorting domain-containing protein [bacterium]
MKKKTIADLLLVCTIIAFPLLSGGQNKPLSGKEIKMLHHEVPDNKFVPYPTGNLKTSPAYRYKGTSVTTVQVNVDAQGNNIVGDAANEPSIAIDPTNPNNIVIGWRQFNTILSNFRQAGYGYSTDAGETWTFPGVIDEGTFRSDPVLGSDIEGNFYYNSLTSNNYGFLCRVFKSFDGGAGWNSGADAFGGDKQWMIIDKSGGEGTGNIYSSWSSFYSSCAPGFFTRSTTGGSSFEDCSQVTGYPYWATMAIGPEGELYIGGVSETQTDGIVVSKSTNAKTPGSIVDWDFYQHIVMDGYLTVQTPINPVGLLGQVSIGVDCSNGPGRGNVYVLASMSRISNNDPADVMFAKSTDGGLSWSDPVRINTDPQTYHYQWFGTMSVSPDGRIDVIWLDTRDDPAEMFKSALYYCYSYDLGITWSDNERISDLFDPQVGYPQQEKMGDYFDMTSDDTGANLAWANTFNGEQDVYYSRIIPDASGFGELAKNDQSISVVVYPNPVKEQATVRYKTSRDGKVRITLCNIFGEEVLSLLEKNQPAGTYTLDIPVVSVPAGYYFCRLTAGSVTKTCRIVKTR